METQKRNKNIIIVLLLLLVMAISALLSECSYSSKLQSSIAKQDSILRNANQRDSLLAEKTKEYTKVITKYVSNCGFTMGDKSISSEDIVKIINDSQFEIEALKDSLNKIDSRNRLSQIFLNDSLNIFKNFLSRIESKYGIVYKLRTDKDGKRFIVSNVSKSDSALAIFPFYRDKLRVDSAGNFIVTYEEKIKVQNKKK